MYAIKYPLCTNAFVVVSLTIRTWRAAFAVLSRVLRNSLMQCRTKIGKYQRKYMHGRNDLCGIGFSIAYHCYFWLTEVLYRIHHVNLSETLSFEKKVEILNWSIKHLAVNSRLAFRLTVNTLVGLMKSFLALCLVGAKFYSLFIFHT